jgi:hypothetical protein
MKKKMLFMLMLVAAGISAFLVVSLYAGSAKQPDMVIDLDVCSNAKVIKIIAYHGKWANQPAVWIQAKVKNVGDKPVQLRSKCYLHNTEFSRGFMVPKVGKPLLKPGKEGTAKFPFTLTELPNKFTIKVEDLGLE